MKFIRGQTSFKAGEISPKLFGRIDIREYQEALSIGTNALIGKHGGAYKRFGLQPIMCVGSIPTNSKPVIKSVTLFGNKTLFFLFYNTVLRILDGEGRDVSNGFISYAGTYLAEDFNIAVHENTVIVAHYSGTKPPLYVEMEDLNGVIKLARAYELSPRAGNYPSYYGTTPMVQVGGGIKIKVLGISGGGDQLQTDASYFTSDMVGERIMITGPCNIQNGVRIATESYRITGYVSSTLVNCTPDFSYIFGDTLSTLNFSNTGGDDTYKLSGTSTDYFDEWYQSAWSSRLGYPKTVCVDEARVVFGGSPSYPATIWGSKTNTPYFFLDKRYYSSSFSWVKTTGSSIYRVDNARFYHTYDGDILETDPYQFTLSTKNGSAITFMESSVNFMVGTSNQEFIVSGNGSAISQKNISARPHTTHGSFKGLSLTYDNTILFVSRSRQSLHLFTYNESNGSYITKEVSILNDDLLDGRIDALAWHEELNIAYMAVAGKLVSLTLNNETQTSAFTKHDIEGYVYDVAFGVNEDSKDYMSVLVQRKDGLLYLEKIDRNLVEPINFGFFNIQDKLSFMDGLRFFRQEEFVTLYNMDKTNNYMHYDFSQLKVGDEVEFSSTNGSILSGTGLSLNTTYYAIPYQNGDISGFRLATSLANAQSNTFIDFTGTGLVNFFNDGGITCLFTRDNQVIPTGHFEIGTEVTVFATQGSSVDEITFIVDGDTYDLGTAYVDVAYGLTYRFHIATAPIEAGQQWGTAQLGLKRIDKASVRINNTRSYKIGTDGYNMEERIPDNGEIFTGRDEVAVTGNPEYDHVIHIQNDKAEPCYISGLVIRGVSNDG